MSQKTELTRNGEFLKWVIDSGFCIERMQLKAATAVTIVPGDILEDDTGLILCLIAQVASVSAIAIVGGTYTGGEYIQCIVRGPALVDPDKMHFSAGITWGDAAAYFAVLKILPTHSTLAVWDTQTF